MDSSANDLWTLRKARCTLVDIAKQPLCSEHPEGGIFYVIN